MRYGDVGRPIVASAVKGLVTILGLGTESDLAVRVQAPGTRLQVESDTLLLPFINKGSS